MSAPCGGKAVRSLKVGDTIHNNQCDAFTILGLSRSRLPMKVVYMAFWPSDNGLCSISQTDFHTYRYLHRPAS